MLSLPARLGFPLAAALAALAVACLAYEPIRPQAASDFDCSTSQIEVTEQEGMYLVSGCGQTAIYHCVVDSQSHQHCTPQGRTEVDTVRMIAPRQMNCPRNKIEIKKQDDGVYAASGCDKEQTFLCQQGQGFFRCRPR